MPALGCLERTHGDSQRPHFCWCRRRRRCFWQDSLDLAVQKKHTETAEAIARDSRAKRANREHNEDEHNSRLSGDDGIESRELSERLFRAFAHSDETQVRELMNLGADINTRYDYEWTLLHSAANNLHSPEDISIILALIEARSRSKMHWMTGSKLHYT